MSTTAKPALAFITLGSNIAPEKNLPRAVVMLRQNYHLKLCAVSRVVESAAISASGAPAPDQPGFLNAAVLVESDGYYTPLQLKFNVLRFIELCLGRVRTADRFAPRPIDLDLAIYGDLVIQSPLLTLPDPDITRRAFVALPLADLMPDYVLPGTDQTLAALAAPFAGTIPVREDVRL